jgi:broad specificity phosphatase PhoE
MAEIYLIRHGQAGAIMGDYDRLSDRGVQQARLLGGALSHLPTPHLAVSGNLKRQRLTAQYLSESFGDFPELQIDPGWNEFDHQTVVHQAIAAGIQAPQARSSAAFSSFFMQAMGRWADRSFAADYPEPYADFQSRVESALERLLIQLRLENRDESSSVNPTRRAFVFTSGGVIAAVCRKILGLSPEGAFSINGVLVNSSYTRILVDDSRLSLASLNVACHLDHHPELQTRS